MPGLSGSCLPAMAGHGMSRGNPNPTYHEVIPGPDEISTPSPVHLAVHDGVGFLPSLRRCVRNAVSGSPTRW
jgi:hypothetical protein